jgi:hypothetical protein
MINPWVQMFDTFITELHKSTEKKVKPYEVTLTTRATVTVLVDASDRDEAIDIAIDMLDTDDVEFGEWDVEDVSLGDR